MFLLKCWQWHLLVTFPLSMSSIEASLASSLIISLTVFPDINQMLLTNQTTVLYHI